MKLPQIGLQLYTLREFLKEPVEIARTLRRVREIGYEAIQVSGMGPIPDSDLVAICQDLGLTICATHERGERILHEPQAVIDRLGKLGCQHTAYPRAAGVDLHDPAALENLVRQLDASGEMLRRAGCGLHYHNHAYEFAKHGSGTILEYIYEGTGAGNLGAELDTYWVQYGGANPEAWCRKMKGRLVILHCKDYAIVPPDAPTFAEIGKGNLDWEGIFAAAEEAGCQWYVVEQDVCAGDPFESVRKSFDYLNANFVR